jgi:hypothetical protein
VCRRPGEQHIPVLNRLAFVLLSLCFNLAVVIAFTATDCSLVVLNCPAVAPKEEGCNALQVSVWSSAQVWSTLRRAPDNISVT